MICPAVSETLKGLSAESDLLQTFLSRQIPLQIHSPAPRKVSRMKRKFSVATFPFATHRLFLRCCCLFFYVFCQELQITPCAVLFPHKYFSGRLLLQKRAWKPEAAGSSNFSERGERERKSGRRRAIDSRERHPEVLKKTLSISWIGSPQFFCL
jgi:hypothetical protein